MRSKNLSKWTVILAVVALATLTTATHTAAQQEAVLHNFNGNGKDGTFPDSGLTFDQAGNLYGTTRVGGAYNDGAVFELVPRSGGGWSEKVLHSFNPNGKDGVNPYGGVVLDASGNLYGTTYFGGTYGFGTAYELVHQPGGAWAEKILHNFNNTGTEGEYPASGLIFDAVGNLYGTTVLSSPGGLGTVFELKPRQGGTWAEKILASFISSGTGGGNPYGSLIFDSAGNLYGTTAVGGFNGVGTVFELTPAKNGTWTPSILYSFNNNGTDGYDPIAALVFDSSGNLYGTTYGGGTSSLGTVFELTRANGVWTETVLHSFQANGDGGNPGYGALILDSSGNVYGTTLSYGANFAGTVFELTPAAGGLWTETVLLSFDTNDGAGPYSGLISDSSGNLYGTAQGGGAYSSGTVFEIKH
jgi:uncharacterized repeat protein (TIGR03803 family)